MSEPELILYYGLSAGAGLAVARIVGALSEYARHPSRTAAFAWLESATSERQRLYIPNDELIRGPGYGQED